MSTPSFSYSKMPVELRKEDPKPVQDEKVPTTPLSTSTTWWSTANTVDSMFSGSSGTSSPNSLPSPTGSSSPGSNSQGSEFSWPSDSGLSGCGSSASSHCGTLSPLPDLPPTTWPPSANPGMPEYNPSVPPPTLHSISFTPFPEPPPQIPTQHTEQLIRSFHGGQGGWFMQELERLFIQEPARQGPALPPARPQRMHNPQPQIQHSLPLPSSYVPDHLPPMPTCFQETTPRPTTRVPATTTPTAYTPTGVPNLRSMPLVPVSDLSDVPKIWEDFLTNGKDADLDEMDRIMMKSLHGRGETKKPQRLPTLDHIQSLGLDPLDPLVRKNVILRLVADSERMASEGKHALSETAAKMITSLKKSDNLCRFCYKNQECEVVYRSHNLKDKEGRITCPILYIYKCPTCGAQGTNAHTKKYCPLNNEDLLHIPALKTGRTSAGRQRRMITGQAYPQAAPQQQYLTTSQLAALARHQQATGAWPTYTTGNQGNSQSNMTYCLAPSSTPQPPPSLEAYLVQTLGNMAL